MGGVSHKEMQENVAEKMLMRGRDQEQDQEMTETKKNIREIE